MLDRVDDANAGRNTGDITGDTIGDNTDNIDKTMTGIPNVEVPNHVRNPQEGKKLRLGTLQLTLKATGVETGDRFTLIEVTVPPYFADTWPHHHRQTTEAIYLLQGMLAVTLGDETMVVRQGTSITVPPEQPHRFWNPTAAPAIYLAFFTPAGMEGYFEALSEVGLTEATWPPTDLARLLDLGMTHDHFPAASPISPEQA